MSVVIGCDPHKHTHTAVAVNASTGELLGELTVDATDDGHHELLRWARALSASRRWAVEDVRQVSGRLQRMLIDGGEDVIAVPPKLMAGTRRSARQRGKSDSIDAKAIALALLREPELPPAIFDQRSRDLKVLLTHREALVVDRSRAQARLRWHLLDLGLERDVPARSLDRTKWLDRVARLLAKLEPSAVVVVSRDLVRQIRQLTREVLALEPLIARLVSETHPELLTIPGCGPLTAAKLIAEIVAAERFATDAKLAMHAGVAPLPCASGRSERFRVNRTGNRQLNLAIHRIALTQSRIHQPARSYLERRQTDGLSKREAMRCLKRHIVRRVYNVMKSRQSLEGLT